jgi:hypothetical protein
MEPTEIIEKYNTLAEREWDASDEDDQIEAQSHAHRYLDAIKKVDDDNNVSTAVSLLSKIVLVMILHVNKILSHEELEEE